MLFDFAIRQKTNNKQSLDDVMRTLYKEYYQKKQRGFTEEELRQVITQTAGDPLTELFDYVYTTKELDYNKYLSYAGLSIDTSTYRIITPTQSWFLTEDDTGFLAGRIVTFTIPLSTTPHLVFLW